jgi:hypothetical protein
MRIRIEKKSAIKLALASTILLLMATGVLAASETTILTGEIQKLNMLAEEMKNSGLGTARMSDMINQARAYLDRNEYNQTRQAIIEAKGLKDLAFRAKDKLSAAEIMMTKVSEQNSKVKSDGSADDNGKGGRITIARSVEWDIAASKKELEMENFGEAERLAATAGKDIISGIRERYLHLNSTAEELDLELSSLEITRNRIIPLKNLLLEDLKTGNLDELAAIEKDLTSMKQGITLYKELELEIQPVEAAGMSIERLKDELELARSSIAIGNLETTIGRLSQAKTATEDALATNKAIELLDRQFQEERPRLIAPESALQELAQLIDSSRREIRLGNYEGAGESARKASEKLEGLRAQSAIIRTKEEGGQDLLTKIRENITFIAITVIILVIIGVFAQKALSTSIGRMRLARHKKELLACEESLKVLQKDYFVKKKTSREGYYDSYDRLQQRMLKLKEAIEAQSKRIKNTSEKRR